jgi:hypothetical protein
MARGPRSYRRWHDHLKKRLWKGAYEVPLYSDSHTALIGEFTAPSLGPYTVLNALRHATWSSPDAVDPIAFVRIDYHADGDADEPLRFLYREGMSKTDDTAFTGATTSDEIACLLSLQLGARLMAGDPVREFLSENDRGRPVTDDARPPMLRLRQPQYRILPWVPGEKKLSELSPGLFKFPQLAPQTAVTLVRAARSYRDAIWIAEGEPDLGWLLLVAALEAAAAHDDVSKRSPVEDLRAANSKLAMVLEAKGADHFETVAKMFHGHHKATARFLGFVMKWLPPAPSRRPPKWGRAQWDKAWMEAAMRTIYDHRSHALHQALPMPAPMCQPPDWLSDDVPAEIPIGGPRHVADGTWLAEDIPINLHTFEYITRNALLGWWNALPTHSPDT